MGPERKDKLAAHEQGVRMRQELDELLATTNRLLEEMRVLTEKAKELTERQARIMLEVRRNRR